MQKELRDKWVKALRSGKYQQCPGALRDPSGNKFCCLGVLCDIERPKGWHDEGHAWEAQDESYLSPEALEVVGMDDDIQRELGEFNDEGMSFCDIAKTIEDMVPLDE